jgi:biotin transport system substrate-specific component
MSHTAPSLTRDRALALTGVVGFALMTGVAAHVAVPLPGTPVPMTLQPLAVLLAGLWLGPRAGAGSILLYLTLGAAGVPVFAPVGPPGLARLVGPTGGYLLAMPIAAFVAGTIAARWRTFPGRALAAAAGLVVIHLGGIAQLVALTGSVVTAATLGTVPFLVGDVVKVLVVAALTPQRRSSATG